MGKSELKQKISLLEQGLPQRWIYIERKVQYPLKSEEKEGVKANVKFLNKSLSHIFHEDLLNVKNMGLAQIRPVIGPNGVGKTTQLEFQVKDYLVEIEPENQIFLFFDFKQMATTEDEFWETFGERLLEQIQENDYINKLTSHHDSFNQKSLLMKNIKNKNIVENIIKLTSGDSYKKTEAEEYFYSGKLQSKEISNLFFGFLKLALKANYTCAIIFDEIQYLDEIDPSKVLVKIFTEKFIRLLFEQFSRNKLYLVISCLQNPTNKEWDKLKSHSKNFQSIVEGKEVILGDLTLKERKEIIQQISDKIGFQHKDKKNFFSKVKSSLDYYVPRTLLRCIANVLDMMDYTTYTKYEIRKIYEKDAREFITPKLKDKGFNFVETDEKEIGGYNLDIYASAPTSRTSYRKKAFGEVSIMNRSNMVAKIEKFVGWLKQMKNVEYNPAKGDFAFFICPPNRITDNSKRILSDNNISPYEFPSKNVEELLKHVEKTVPGPEVNIEDIPAGLDTGEIIVIKDSRYQLEDIKGIAETRANQLREIGITTVKELINCNSSVTAQKIKGVGKISINKWKQIARQLLN